MTRKKENKHKKRSKKETRAAANSGNIANKDEKNTTDACSSKRFTDNISVEDQRLQNLSEGQRNKESGDNVPAAVNCLQNQSEDKNDKNESSDYVPAAVNCLQNLSEGQRDKESAHNVPAAVNCLQKLNEGRRDKESAENVPAAVSCLQNRNDSKYDKNVSADSIQDGGCFQQKPKTCTADNAFSDDLELYYSQDQPYCNTPVEMAENCESEDVYDESYFKVYLERHKLLQSKRQKYLRLEQEILKSSLTIEEKLNSLRALLDIATKERTESERKSNIKKYKSHTQKDLRTSDSSGDETLNLEFPQNVTKEREFCNRSEDDAKVGNFSQTNNDEHHIESAYITLPGNSPHNSKARKGSNGSNDDIALPSSSHRNGKNYNQVTKGNNRNGSTGYITDVSNSPQKNERKKNDNRTDNIGEAGISTQNVEGTNNSKRPAENIQTTNKWLNYIKLNNMNRFLQNLNDEMEVGNSQDDTETELSNKVDKIINFLESDSSEYSAEDSTEESSEDSSQDSEQSLNESLMYQGYNFKSDSKDLKLSLWILKKQRDLILKEVLSNSETDGTLVSKELLDLIIDLITKVEEVYLSEKMDQSNSMEYNEKKGHSSQNVIEGKKIKDGYMFTNCIHEGHSCQNVGCNYTNISTNNSQLLEQSSLTTNYNIFDNVEFRKIIFKSFDFVKTYEAVLESERRFKICPGPEFFTNLLSNLNFQSTRGDLEEQMSEFSSVNKTEPTLLSLETSERKNMVDPEFVTNLLSNLNFQSTRGYLEEQLSKFSSVKNTESTLESLETSERKNMVEEKANEKIMARATKLEDDPRESATCLRAHEEQSTVINCTSQNKNSEDIRDGKSVQDMTKGMKDSKGIRSKENIQEDGLDKLVACEEDDLYLPEKYDKNSKTPEEIILKELEEKLKNTITELEKYAHTKRAKKSDDSNEYVEKWGRSLQNATEDKENDKTNVYDGSNRGKEALKLMDEINSWLQNLSCDMNYSILNDIKTTKISQLAMTAKDFELGLINNLQNSRFKAPKKAEDSESEVQLFRERDPLYLEKEPLTALSKFKEQNENCTGTKLKVKAHAKNKCATDLRNIAHEENAAKTGLGNELQEITPSKLNNGDKFFQLDKNANIHFEFGANGGSYILAGGKKHSYSIEAKNKIVFRMADVQVSFMGDKISVETKFSVFDISFSNTYRLV